MSGADPGPGEVEEVVGLDGRELLIVRPRDSEALLDEEAFEQEELLPYWAELWPSALALARAVGGRGAAPRARARARLRPRPAGRSPPRWPAGA